MSAVQAAGRFDPAEWRKVQRHGRQKAGRVNITAEQLRAAGLDPDGGPFVYRVWTGERGRFIVTVREEQA